MLFWEMSANFKSGEVLTAAALNDAINGVLPGRRGAVAPGVQGATRQNRVPVPVLSADRPVYLDKASLALKDGEPEGWYIQQNGQLVHLPNVRENAPVYLVINTDSDGRETSREWTSTQQVAAMWDPLGKIPGRVVHMVGRTAENPFMKSGPGSQRHVFYPVNACKVQTELVNFAVDDCDLPQGWREFPLLLDQQGNTRPVRAIQSSGGLLQVPPASGSENRQPLALAPRVSLFHLGDDTCAPGTSYFEDPATMLLGTWQPLASLKIGGQDVTLNGYWVTPWKVGLSFAPSTVDVAGGMLEKKAWQGATPVVGQNPHGLGPWKRVSYTPLVPLLTPGVSVDCGYEVYDYAVYEAPGTYAPGTFAPGSADPSLIQRVLWVAQMRRQRHPQNSDWECFEKTEMTTSLS